LLLNCVSGVGRTEKLHAIEWRGIEETSETHEKLEGKYEE